MIPDYVREQAKYELARRYFWDYCKLTSPEDYRDDREFLSDMCNELQDFINSDDRVMVINLPPRHYKTRTISKFVQWLLGNSSNYRIMTGSYNERLSSSMAKSVRDTIQEKDGIYEKIFPNTKIKYGEASMNKWALEDSPVPNYLATSPKGTATGFGCNIMIIDDVIKNDKEAYNELLLEDIIDWFNNTMLQRTESGFKIILVMTRWVSNDLAGYILDNYENVRHITYKAIQDDGTMLCDEILSREEYEFKIKEMNKDIADANYNQICADEKGRLYKNLKTYQVSPGFGTIYADVDTADTGDDYVLVCMDY